MIRKTIRKYSDRWPNLRDTIKGEAKRFADAQVFKRLDPYIDAAAMILIYALILDAAQQSNRRWPRA